jgi:hypothetical protein
MFRILGGGVLTLVVVVVIVLVALVPLLLIFRSTCEDRDDTETRYSFVAPWDDPPAECRDHQRAYEFLLDEVGL